MAGPTSADRWGRKDDNEEAVVKKLSKCTDDQLLRRCARYVNFMTRSPRGVKIGTRRWKEWAARAMLAAERENAVRLELLKRYP